MASTKKGGRLSDTAKPATKKNPNAASITPPKATTSAALTGIKLAPGTPLPHGQATPRGSMKFALPAASKATAPSSGRKNRNTVSPASSKTTSSTDSDQSQDETEEDESQDEIDDNETEEDETEEEDESESEMSDETEDTPQTPVPARKGNLKRKRSAVASTDKKKAITPSTVATDCTNTDPFFDGDTPELNDSTIPFSLKRRHKSSTPPGSPTPSDSDTPSTPTKSPSKRRRTEPARPRLPSHAETVEKVKSLSAELKAVMKERKRLEAEYLLLVDENNATPEMLDAAVETCRARLQTAVTYGKSSVQESLGDSGIFMPVYPDPYHASNHAYFDPPTMVPYTSEELQPMKDALSKAYYKRECWYGDTRYLFRHMTALREEVMPRIWNDLQKARAEEAAARQREGNRSMTATPGARPKEVMLSGGRPLHKPSPSMARIRQALGQTPGASPGASSVASSATLQDMSPGTSPFGTPTRGHLGSPTLPSSPPIPWSPMKRAGAFTLGSSPLKLSYEV
ncbi:hypothetical protein CkaCkLH20_09168 [Colletotrichum karsti]|uniref:Uncharacterized protein n=1 Tax=Colletotrichum karsti TaxID=1095194 RepID=A0A9P6I7C9_9PEZI|nr:uncharacterized protein CkaCkLH20_09168 [Colletotrichum karsti]KAF9873355.1 hypothetical protein CkaCkLH20_09168 [Colletotrichum karsti]